MRCSKYGVLIWGLDVAIRRGMGTARHFCEGFWVGALRGGIFPGSGLRLIQIAISWRLRFSKPKKGCLAPFGSQIISCIKRNLEIRFILLSFFLFLSWSGWICQFIQSHSHAPASCTSKVAFARFRKLFWDSPRRTWFHFSTSPNSSSSLQKVP